MYGLTCDNLLSADVVTADGRLLTASATDNADLFWGLRGGGGNFGIVTSFDYQLHEVGPVLAGPAVYPLSAAANVFRFYREYTTSAPDNVFLEFGMAALPDGQRVVMLFVVYVGPIEAGEEVVRPIRDFESPLEVAIVPMSYCDVQRAYDGDFPFGLLNYWKSSNLRELSDDAIETMVAFMESAPSDRPMVIIDQFGGAVARVPNDATAFGHRDAAYDLIIAAVWSDPSEQEAHIDWARRFWNAMQPYASDDVYVNYLSEEGAERVRAAYGHHYARLVELKRRYDPQNVFQHNQNISLSGLPAAGRTRASGRPPVTDTGAGPAAPRKRDGGDRGGRRSFGSALTTTEPDGAWRRCTKPALGCQRSGRRRSSPATWSPAAGERAGLVQTRGDSCNPRSTPSC